MGVRPCVLLLLAVLCCATALPHSQRPKRQLSEKEILDMFSSSTKAKETINSNSPRIISLRVKSDIENRYAHTMVESRVVNPANVSQEVFFTIIIPEKAFITAFSMEIDGKIYKAYIKEKEKAREQYEEAVKKGQAAAHVHQTARDSDRFTTSVNVKARTKVTFFLHYEELLMRDLGLYNHIITLNPGNIVPEMSLDVHIKEPSEISDLAVNNIQSANEIDPQIKENPKAQVEYINPKEVKVHVTVDEEEQRKLQKLTEDGAAGQLSVKYNVAPKSSNGDIIVDSNGYFVHFFSPANETTQKKHVLFVLDTSGSMHGRKILQLKKAMEVILDELHPDDIFNIIEFSSSVTVRNLDGEAYSAVYHPFSMPFTQVVQDENNVYPFHATPEYKKKAKTIINRMTADGGTNIQDALKTTLNIVKKSVEKPAGPVNYEMEGPDMPQTDKKPKIVNEYQPIIMFLTDGDPTVGVTNFAEILKNVKSENTQEVRLFSLAFGDDANFEFLKNLSFTNFGTAKKIYEASDSAIQLNHFYKHISALILSNVKFIYPPNQIIDNRITKRQFNNLFKGSDIVISGQLDPKLKKYEIEGSTANGIKKYEIIIPDASSRSYGPLERLYAYLTISQLLDKSNNISNAEEEALSLAKRDYWKQVKSFIQLLITWIQSMLGFVQSLLSDAYDYTYIDTTPKSRLIENPKETALKLALKYSFVCPLTSLVVVKPDGDAAQEPEKASPTATPNQPGFAAPMSGGQAFFLASQASPIRRKIVHQIVARPLFPLPGLGRIGTISNQGPYGIGSPFPDPIFTEHQIFSMQGPSRFDQFDQEEELSPVTTTTTPSPPETTTALPETTTAALPLETTELATEVTTMVLPSETTTIVEATTTALPETTTRAFAVKHLSQIPWLGALRSGNILKIYTPEGNKNLILSPPKELNVTEPCRVFDKIGECRPLYTCISDAIKSSAQDYIQHMCDLPGNYAGVCCLPGVNVTETIETDDSSIEQTTEINEASTEPIAADVEASQVELDDIPTEPLTTTEQSNDTTEEIMKTTIPSE